MCLPVFHYTPFATIPNGYGDYHSNPTMVVHSHVPMFFVTLDSWVAHKFKGGGGRGEEELGPIEVMLLFG